MKVLIIGGVAAGTKVAAKLKREDPGADVTIITKGKDISYAGCGLPYYVGNVIKEREQLVVNTPEAFSNLTGVTVKTQTEAVSLNRSEKIVEAVDEVSGEKSTYSYDKLVIAAGASPFRPNCPGLDLENVFVMRTPADATALREAVEAGGIKRAVVVGGGFIGLEVAENLNEQGVKVSVIDFAPHILPGFLDPEFSGYVEDKLADDGVMCFTGVALEEIIGTEKVEKVKTSKRAMKADACILAMGIRPNTAFLNDTGIEMFKGTVLTNEYLQTNDPDIYAVGDCAMVKNRVTDAPQWSPMGSTANIAGRIAAMNIAGGRVSYPGVLGTGVAKLPGICVGRTGLNEKPARDAGFDVETVVTVVDDKAHYFPGAGAFIIKMIADKATQRLLGIQVLGGSSVDKIVDIAVTAISMKAAMSDLQNMDFAYAPPFSTAIHPFQHTVNIMMNKLSGGLESITPAQYAAGEAEDYKVIDTAINPTIKSAPYVDLTKVDGPVDGFDKDEKLLLVCAKGKRGYLLQNRMKHHGYTNTRVLEGGVTFNPQVYDED